MEEKIKKILEKYDEIIYGYEKQIKEVDLKIVFFKEHNFKEEERIAKIKFNAIEILLYRFRSMHKELNDMFNDWMN